MDFFKHLNDTLLLETYKIANEKKDKFDPQFINWILEEIRKRELNERASPEQYAIITNH